MKRDVLGISLILLTICIVLLGIRVRNTYLYWEAKVIPMVETGSTFLNNASATSADVRAIAAQTRALVESLSNRVTMLESQNKMQAELLEQKEQEFKTAMGQIKDLQASQAVQSKPKSESHNQKEN